MTYHESATKNGTTIRLFENPVDEENLKVELQAGGLTIRAELTEDSAHAIADALNRWYAPTTQHYGAGPLPIDEMDDWLNPTTPLPGRVASNQEVAADLTGFVVNSFATRVDPKIWGYDETTDISHHDFTDTLREYRSGRDGIVYNIPTSQHE